MNVRQFFSKYVYVLSPEQKKKFQAYLPEKVYTTERNISILVAGLQLCMIILFLSNRRISFQNMRSVGYFSLYIFLLFFTCLAIFLYRYTVLNKKYRAFLWLRRIYACILCFWLLGITFLEQMNGNGLSVYCYLLPTTAALLLLNPLESVLIFGSTWIGLVSLLLTFGYSRQSIFGDMVNGIFVTVLALFISLRYYRSMAVEFCDRETIADQYHEIKTSNGLLEKLVNTDQLTGLYNRHCLQEIMYPKFADHVKKEGNSLCLMMDIDYFKQYNDLYGHLQGDECLRQLSKILRDFCDRHSAVAIRYGGEEFLIVKISEAPFDAALFAESLTDRIKQGNIIRTDVEKGRVTVSMGLWHDGLFHVNELEKAIQSADRALYQAKSQGRDRICLAGQEG